TVVHKQALHPSEGTLVEIKGKVKFDINVNELVIPEKVQTLSEAEIREEIFAKPMFVVAATIGNDEHSVGMKETLDIKHGGIEGFGIKYLYLGTSCPVEKLVDAAIETNADAILASTIITHDDVHTKNMRKIHDLCVEKGIRDKVMLIVGGTQVTNEIAVEAGMDAGFGRGTHGIDVASYLVKRRREK
ncbi:MAG: cobalamin-dependent protein, partial [Clostridiaceae bacterium]|nr:cobalamin-dependent protein [Clostridiaceae bacterium]